MENQFKVVIHPTNEASTVFISTVNDKLLFEDKEESGRPFAINQHVYIVDTEATIEAGDWWYKPTGKINIGQCSLNIAFNNPEWLNSSDCKDVVKIICSTNALLGLPTIDNLHFLQAVCSYGIDNVEIKGIQVITLSRVCLISWRKKEKFKALSETYTKDDNSNG